MNSKKIFGIALIICGVAMLLVSNYITTQVEEGKGRIQSAESTVGMGKSILSLSPATDQLGKGLTKSADKKIKKGKQQVAEYERLAHQLQIGGIILMIAGAGIFLIGMKKK